MTSSLPRIRFETVFRYTHVSKVSVVQLSQNEAYTLGEARKTTQAARQTKAPIYERWALSIDYVLRKFKENKTKKQQEHPQDKYSRRTANATFAMAVFTGILIVVNSIQLREIQNSGAESSDQTNQTIHEMRSQVAQIKRQATDTHDLAIAAGKQADASKALADQTKAIAGQAVVQANAGMKLARQVEASVQMQQERLSVDEGNAVVKIGWMQLCYNSHTVFADVIAKSIGTKADISIAVDLRFRKPTFKDRKDPKGFQPVLPTGSPGEVSVRRYMPDREYARRPTSSNTLLYVWGAIKYAASGGEPLRNIPFCKYVLASSVLFGKKPVPDDTDAYPGDRGDEYRYAYPRDPFTECN